MDITPITLILVGAICLILGYIACSLINTLGEDEVQEVEEGTQVPPGGKKGRYIPVVRLWRDKQSGIIIVEAEGKSYASAVPLDETKRHELEMIAREFRGWLGMGITNSPALLDIPANGVDASPVGVKNSAAQTEAPIVVAGSEKVKLKPRNTASPVAAPDTVLLAGSKSIVMQIEDILQDLISSGPLATRGVHLSEDLSKGVIVTVGSEKYDGIDAVPDPEIKSVIRAAVAAWENQQ